jgi:hypothetical protein
MMIPTKGKYSFAVCPPDETVAWFREKKDELASHIGWYPSKNSAAHITINVFEADDKELVYWKKYASEFCGAEVPFQVMLVKTGSYSSGAFYLSPDHASVELLKTMMNKFNDHAPFSEAKISDDPHISIARRLKAEQLKVANELWGAQRFDRHFLCDNIALRKFDVRKKQYTIEQRFYFGPNVTDKRLPS